MDSGESHCQRQGLACISCCGLWNLNIPDQQKQNLLEERTERYASVRPDFSAATMSFYRQSQESLEADIPRHDHEVYVCPFLGLLDEDHPGCMAHPVCTGQSNSQNFSFYGASICQAYDCPVKEEDSRGNWSDLIAKISPDWWHYSRLVCDYQLYMTFTNNKDDWKRIIQHSASLELFWQVAQQRLKSTASKKITSFEIQWEEKTDLRAALFYLFKDQIDSGFLRAQQVESWGLAFRTDLIADDEVQSI